MTLDEVRLLDNQNALIFIRGEKPIMDKKFDILSHPNIKFTEDGGAEPYKHSKNTDITRDDLSFTVREDISNVKFIEETIKTYEDTEETNEKNQ